MEPSELPPFPTPEPPHPAPAAPPARRGMPMFLQLLFLLAFWPAVYITHEQSAAMIAAEQKAREQEETVQKKAREREERRVAIERIGGRWVSAHGDKATLNFVEDRLLHFRFVDPDGDFRTVFLGSVESDGQSYLLTLKDAEVCSARITGEELVIEFGEFGEQYFTRRGLPWNGVWRFRRLKEKK